MATTKSGGGKTRKTGKIRGEEKNQAGEDVLAGCRKCKKWDQVKSRMRVAEVIAKSVDSVQERIKNGGFNPTVAEYLKLVQMEQELEQKEETADGPKEIKVTWVEPPAELKPGK